MAVRKLKVRRESRGRTEEVPRLTSIHVTNYMSLRSVDVRLGPVNVLVGPNAAGKSNFLDVVRLLGDCARGADLTEEIAERGGFDRVRFRGESQRPALRPRIRIEVKAQVTQHASEGAPDEYLLFFGPQDHEAWRRETFKFKRKKGRGRRMALRSFALSTTGEDVLFKTDVETKKLALLQPEELALGVLPRLALREQREFLDQLRRFSSLLQSFRVFDVDVRAARRPTPVPAEKRATERPALAPDASNLSLFLRSLSSEEEVQFAKLVDDARLMTPGLLDLRFRAIGGAGGATVAEIKERGLKGWTSLAEASDGTVRMLALLAMLHDPAPPAITAVEEIDQGLHPYVFDRLIELVREASTRTQLLMATHSPALVNRLHADELIVCERSDDGSSLIPAIDPVRVKQMEREVKPEGIGLGELWFTGSLGGVPS